MGIGTFNEGKILIKKQNVNKFITWLNENDLFTKNDMEETYFGEHGNIKDVDHNLIRKVEDLFKAGSVENEDYYEGEEVKWSGELVNYLVNEGLITDKEYKKIWDDFNYWIIWEVGNSFLSYGDSTIEFYSDDEFIKYHSEEMENILFDNGYYGITSKKWEGLTEKIFNEEFTDIYTKNEIQYMKRQVAKYLKETNKNHIKFRNGGFNLIVIEND